MINETGNKIGDKGAKALANSLSRNTTLGRLNLGSQQLTSQKQEQIQHEQQTPHANRQ